MKSLCVILLLFSAFIAFSQIQFSHSILKDNIALNDITKEYNRTIKVESKEGERSKFIIQLLNAI